jgi:hypothetical protein
LWVLGKLQASLKALRSKSVRFCADLQPKYAGCDAVAYLYSVGHAIMSNSLLGLPLYVRSLATD